MKIKLETGLVILALSFASWSTMDLSAADDFLVKDRLKQIEHYHDAVSTLNLLNGLHLSNKQIQALLELNKSMRTLEKTYLDNRDFVELRNDTEDALKALYDYMKKHPEKENSQLQEAAQKAHHEFKSYSLMRAEDLKQDINKIAHKAEGILTAEQRKVVNDFLPCIVPPKDLRDPVKAGQAEQSNQKALEILDRIRKVKNPKIFNAAADKVAGHLIELSNTYYYKMSQQEQAREKKRIVNVLRYASSLNDTEFELKKTSIIKQLIPNAEKLTKLYEQVDQRNPHTSGLGNLLQKRIIKYLLNPDITIPILESWQNAERAGGLR